MDKFTITLPNDKIKTYRMLLLLISLINIVMLSLFKFRMPTDSLTGYVISGAIGATSAPLLLWLFAKKDQDRHSHRMITGILISCTAWFMLGFVLAGISLMVVSLLALMAIRTLLVIVDHTGIVYPSIPAQKLNWSEVDNLLLKDGILTIDLKNNKLMQFRIAEKDNPALDEHVFNTFVTEQLKSQKTT